MNIKKNKTIGIRTDDHFLKYSKGHQKCIMHPSLKSSDLRLQELMECP